MTRALNPSFQSRYFTLGVIILAAFLSLFSHRAKAEENPNQAASTVKKGVFLLSSEKIRDTNFSQSVIYVTEHGEGGTFGVIVNKPTYIPVNDAMPENQQVAEPDAKIFFGGPTHAQHLFVLTKAHEGERLHAVTENVYFGAGDQIVIKLNSDEHKTETRTFLGFSSWTPGQLEEEVKAGQWIVVPGDEKALFEKDAKTMWKKLIKRWSGQWL